MKSRIVAVAIFALTAATVVFYPALKSSGAVFGHSGIQNINHIYTPPTNLHPRVEVVFVLDTTGSMGGLIEAAKDKIWSIATTMASAQQSPEISMGLVADRDRGDQYVTRVADLSQDLDSIYAALMDFSADGGGDGPESVNQALYDAVNSISWSQDPNSYKVIFLVGDAPPHMDYQDDVKYPLTLRQAAARGIVVNTIQCGENAATTPEWQRIASLSKGRYFQVEQAGSALAMATPFDADLARLSAELDGTRLYYGTAEEKQEKNLKLAATEKLHAFASSASRARRAAFNATASGVTNLFGSKELVDDLESGRVTLEEIDADALPEPLQQMSPEEQRAAVAKTTDKRRELRDRIQELSQQRDDYIDNEVEDLGGAEASLEYKIYDAVREQAEKKGLKYEDGPEF